MKVSGFTFVRNAEVLYIPVQASIASVLPLVDEMVVALGAGDPGDQTEAWIQALNSPKIKIIRTTWDTEAYPKNTIYAQQTDLAKAHCSGDWLVYIQADEALHEDDHPNLRAAMNRYLDEPRVEGFLLNYLHFWGDYQHVHRSHAWYKHEVRIIRNRPDIHSWRDAQSFRKYAHFQPDSWEEYLRKDTTKLNVIALNASVFHYGFVRPPHIMSGKRKRTDATYHGEAKAEALLKLLPDEYDYGPLNRIPTFSGTHPHPMQPWINQFNWGTKLQYQGKPNTNRLLHPHERFKNRLLSWVENNLLGGKTLFDFQNYTLIR
jgi:hypothetical protein